MDVREVTGEVEGIIVESMYGSEEQPAETAERVLDYLARAGLMDERFKVEGLSPLMGLGELPG